MNMPAAIPLPVKLRKFKNITGIFANAKYLQCLGDFRQKISCEERVIGIAQTE
jgi:hypothetical protein